MRLRGRFPPVRYAIGTWRRTPAGRDALRAFPGRKVRELAAIVGAGPGFEDTGAGREFPRSVRMWACKWLASADKPAKPTPVEVRDALARVEQAAETLHRALDALPAEAMELLAHRLTWRPGLPSELVFTKLRPTRKLEDFAPA